MFDLVQNGTGDIPGTQKITMQGMHHALWLDGLLCGREGLPHHLAAEDSAESQILALTTIPLGIEVQGLPQLGDIEVSALLQSVDVKLDLP